MLTGMLRVVTCVFFLWMSAGDAHAQEASEADQDEGAAAEAELMPVERYDRLRDTQRVLEYGTVGALAITASLGVVTYLNKPTLTDDGLCREGDPVLGSYGCNGLSTVHGIAGVTTLVLYTGAGAMDLALPDPPEDARGSAFDDPLTAVHASGLVILPLLGIISSDPGTLDIDPADRADFSRVTRTIHAGVAVVTAGAFVASLFID